MRTERLDTSRGGDGGSSPAQSHTALDETDHKIITELQEDGRRSYRDIARSLDLNESTIRARVRRMEDMGALRIVAFADPYVMGDSVMALVFLRVDAAHLDSVTEALLPLPEVSYVSSLLGPYSLCLQVQCADTATLWTLVRRRLEILEGVQASETWIEQEVHKLQFRAPLTPNGHGA